MMNRQLQCLLLAGCFIARSALGQEFDTVWEIQQHGVDLSESRSATTSHPGEAQPIETVSASSSDLFVALPRDLLIDLSAALRTYVSVLDMDDSDVDHREALNRIFLFRDVPLSASENRLLGLSGWVDKFRQITYSIDRDIDDFSHGRFALARAQTIEQLGRLGLDLLGNAKNNTNLSGPIRETLGRLDGYADTFTAIAQHIGTRQLTVDIAEGYINGAREIAQAELFYLKRASPSFVLTEGAQDLTFAVVRSVEKGRVDIDSVTHGLDALNKLAWTGLGVSACGTSVACTAAIKEFGVASARLGRRVTRPVFDRIVLRLSGNRRKILDQYASLQIRNISMGQPVQTLREVYGTELLRDNGFSENAIREYDDLHGVGGVNLGVEPKYYESDLSDLSIKPTNLYRDLPGGMGAIK